MTYSSVRAYQSDSLVPEVWMRGGLRAPAAGRNIVTGSHAAVKLLRACCCVSACFFPVVCTGMPRPCPSARSSNTVYSESGMASRLTRTVGRARIASNCQESAMAAKQESNHEDTPTDQKEKLSYTPNDTRLTEQGGGLIHPEQKPEQVLAAAALELPMLGRYHDS